MGWKLCNAPSIHPYLSEDGPALVEDGPDDCLHGEGARLPRHERDALVVVVRLHRVVAGHAEHALQRNEGGKLLFGGARAGPIHDSNLRLRLKITLIDES